MKASKLVLVCLFLGLVVNCTSIRLSLETKPITPGSNSWTKQPEITSTGSRGSNKTIVLPTAQDIRVNTNAKSSDAKIDKVTIEIVKNGLSGMITSPPDIQVINPAQSEVNGGLVTAANRWESIRIIASATDTKGRTVTTGTYELQLYSNETLSWSLAKVGGAGEVDFGTEWISRRPQNWPNDDKSIPVDNRKIGFVQNNGRAAVTIDFISIATGQIVETVTVQPGDANRNRQLAGREIGSGYFRILGGQNPGSTIGVAF